MSDERRESKDCTEREDGHYRSASCVKYGCVDVGGGWSLSMERPSKGDERG